MRGKSEDVLLLSYLLCFALILLRLVSNGLKCCLFKYNFVDFIHPHPIKPMITSSFPSTLITSIDM